VMAWTRGRGLLGPLKPLIGDWVTEADDEAVGMLMRCRRTFKPLGAGWIALEAEWDLHPRAPYREIAVFGAKKDGDLGFDSFTSDGKRSEGRLASALDIHPQAVAFEARMPAGLARMLYWPREGLAGFHFAVESRRKSGWNRFLRQTFGPAPDQAPERPLKPVATK
jgi:hypothetical protein